jgi:hypothetical protein
MDATTALPSIAEFRQGGVSVIIASLLAVAANVVLRAFFHAFKVTWPKRYFGGNRVLDLYVASAAWRFALFRLGPVFAALAIVGTASVRLGSDRQLAIALTGVSYAVVSLWREALDAIKRPINRREGTFVLVLGTGILVSTLGALALGSSVDRFVPTFREVGIAAWIAVFVFIFGQGMQSLVSRPNLSELVKRAQNEIDPVLLNRLDEVDPWGIFRSVAIAEHLNRPPWFRAIERRVRPHRGTHGLMQMRSTHPLTDLESVEKFIEMYRHHVPGEDDYWSSNRERAFVSTVNADPAFVELVLDVAHKHEQPEFTQRML